LKLATSIRAFDQYKSQTTCVRLSVKITI